MAAGLNSAVPVAKGSAWVGRLGVRVGEVLWRPRATSQRGTAWERRPLEIVTREWQWTIERWSVGEEMVGVGDG